jgi:uncharacterized Tic20 family protein
MQQNSNERIPAMWCHLAPLVLWLISVLHIFRPIDLVSWVVPLGIYLYYRDRDPFGRHHAAVYTGIAAFRAHKGQHYIYPKFIALPVMRDNYTEHAGEQ